MNKASCLSLLSNAELVWKAMMKKIVQLRAIGETIADEDLAANLTPDVPARHIQRIVSPRQS